MKKLLFFLAMAIVFAIQLPAQVTIVIGDTTSSTTSSYVPAYYLYEDAISEAIYRSEEMQPGLISSIGYWHNGSSYNNGDIRIYMKEVTETEITGSFLSGENWQEVYSGPVQLPANSCVTINLATPFTYTGEGNLAVAFIRDGTAWTSGHTFKASNTSWTSCAYKYTDGVTYSVTTPPSGTATSTRPVTKFDILPLGTDFCYPPVNLVFSDLTTEGVTLTWGIINEASTTFAVEYKSANDEEWIVADGGITDTTYTLTGLDSYTTYQVKVYTVCSESNSTELNTSFITLPTEDDFITLPFDENFDDLENLSFWTLTNPHVNKWYVGPAGHNTTSEDASETGNGLYISNDNGVTNAYANNSTSVAHASVLMNIEVGNFYEIAFDYKAVGEGSCCDYVGVRLVPFGNSLGTAINLTNEIGKSPYGTDDTWQRISIPVPASIQPGAYYLSFTWRNDGTSGSNPPAAIDNVSVYETGCTSTVLNTSLDYFETDEGPSIIVTLVDTINTDVTYNIQYKASNSDVWLEVTDLTIEDFPYSLIEGIAYSSVFNVRVGVMCDDMEEASYAGQVNITTPCGAINAPWIENFDVTPFSEGTCWNRYTGQMPSEGVIATTSLTSSSSNWNYANLAFGGVTSGMMACNPYSSGQYYWLVTPSFNLGEGDVAKQFVFNVGARGYDFDSAPASAPDDKFIFMVSLDNGATWDIANGVVFADGDADEVHNYSSLTNQMTPFVYALVDENGEPLTGIVRFAFYAESTVYNGDNYLGLDNFAFEDMPTCPNPYSISVIESSITSSTANVVFGYTGPSTSWEYVVVEGVDADPDSGSPIEVDVNGNIELTDLTPETVYLVAVRAICDGENSEWITTTFTTLAEAETIPYETTFDEGLWSVNNGAATPNAWVVGEGTGNEAPAAYISNDGTAYAATTNSVQTISHLWKDFDFGETEDAFELSFDWKATGRVEGTSAYGGIAVYLTDRAPLPTSGFLNSEDLITVIALSDTWETESIYLGNITGEKRLVFTAFGYIADTELTTPAAIDNVSFTVSACSQVQELTLSNPTTSSIDVAWTETDADSYTISYRAEGTEEVLTTSATSSPVTLEGLTSSTQYYVSITAVCGTNEAVPSPTKSINTLQEAVELPYTCDFEEEGSNGWLLKNGSCTNKWYIGTPAGATSASLFISNNNGVSAVYSTSSSSTVVAEKLFQLGATDSISISFDIAIGGESSFDYLKVYWAPITENYEPTSNGDAPFAASDYGDYLIMNNYIPEYSYQNSYRFVNLITGTQNMSVTLANDYPNELRKLVLVWVNDNTSGNGQGAVIDNVMVQGVGEEMSCTKPSVGVVSDITESSATITWIDNDPSHSSWNVYYQAGGAEDWSVVSVTEPMVDLTDLTPSSTYNVYLTTDCGNEESNPTATFVFSTSCGTIAAYPYLENFEGSDFGCWTTETISGESFQFSSIWSLMSLVDAAGVFTPIGQQSAYHTFETGVSGRLVTPVLDLTVLTNPYIKFNYQRLSDGVVEGLTLQYRTDADATWTELAVMNGTPDQWVLDSIALPNPSATYQIGFVSSGVYGYGVAIDDVMVYDADGEGGTTDPEPDPCDAPTALAANNITETTADITWTGTATSYEVRLNGAAAESVSGTTKQYTGLTANTAYTVELRAVCEGQTSDWVSVQFTTLEEEVVVVTPPTVTTLAATNITHESAVLNGTITAGNETITAQGFMYKVTAAADWTTVAATGANITATLTALTAETAYSFKAFATTASGTVEGTVMTFT
ncbi:MAG: fibronectin type III domain-containing protein, partial [Bacteroidales bacterium]|nr:fibronectin type III domain-containing protein [Bacteroidales bacterium]